MPELGPHLLGRKPNPPDERDWTTEKLHAVVGPPESLLDSTVREAIAGSPYFRSWKGVRALWGWIKAHLAPTPAPGPPTTPTLWADDVLLDQGNFGTCIGNGGAGWLASEPIVDPAVDEKLARALYFEATVFDGTPDDPDAPGGGQTGSTVRSLAKALKARGRLTAYAFARNMAEVDEWLDNHGPVVIGVDWTQAMFTPDADGVIHVTGVVKGGHCVIVRYRVPGTTRKRIRNSWGEWGIHGDCEIETADLQKLLTGLSGYPGDFLLATEMPLGA